MVDLITQIQDAGVTVVILALFIFQYILQLKNNYQNDKEYLKTINAMTEAINGLGELVKVQVGELNSLSVVINRHDERSILIDKNLNEIKTMVNHCSK